MSDIHNHKNVEDISENVVMYAAKRVVFADPLYPDQWHLKNTGQKGLAVRNDIAVEGAWNLGYDGNKILIQIIDDGLDYKHDDLKNKYMASARYNIKIAM